MSLESALEEERLEILKLLEGPARRQSGAQSTPSSPRMGYASLARTTSPQRHVSSLIDAVAGVSPRNRTPVHSGSSSPVDSYSPSNDMFRSRSEIGGNPRILGSRGSGPGSYDFPMMPSLGGSGTKKRTASQPSMLDSGMFPQRSKSPLANPAFNHHGRAISPNSEDSSGYRSPPRSEHMLMSGGGVMIDLDHAYARLNDDALSRSGGALAKLPERRPILDKHGDAVRAGMGESLTKDGGLRLQKDVNSDDEAVMDSSDEDSSDQEDSDPASSDEEGRGRPSIRNRVASLVKSPSEPGGRTVNSDRETGIVQGGKKKGKKNRKKGKRKTMSLLAAAEEERMSAFIVLHLNLAVLTALQANKSRRRRNTTSARSCLRYP